MAGKRGQKNLYAILEVDADADVETIKKAYRRLAQENHPDLNPDDHAAEERFKSISQAYGVLSDPERRANYDEFGEIALDPNFDAAKARQYGGAFGGGPDGFDPRSEMGGAGGLGSLFEELFGSQRGGPFQPLPQRGSDLESDLELDFMEAARGAERQITVRRPQPSGKARVDTLTVRIPAGVDDGARIRLAGKGGEGANGGPPGDLLARIRVRPHPVFRREEQNLYLEVPISISEAILGADIEIPTLDGRVTLHIAPGTDGGSKLRLREKGFPASGRRTTGDLYVTVQIRVPKNVDPDQHERIRELSPSDAGEMRRDLFR